MVRKYVKMGIFKRSNDITPDAMKDIESYYQLHSAAGYSSRMRKSSGWRRSGMI